MDPQATRARIPWSRDGIVQLAALIVVVFGLQAGRSWLLPICFALLIAVIGSVPLRMLTTAGLPRPLAALLSLGTVGGAAWLLGRAFVRAVGEFAAKLPRYEARLTVFLDDAVGWLGSLGFDIDVRKLVASIEPRAWVGFAQQSVGGVMSLLSALLLVAIATTFLLWEADRLHARLKQAFGSDWDPGRVTLMLADMQRYLGVKVATSTLTGVLVYVLNRLLGIESPLLWGLLAFALNFVPIVGSIIAAVPPLLLALAVPDLGLPIAVPLGIGYLAINNLISNLLEPVLMGRQFGMPAFAVLLSLAFWGWVWGPGGMFLAVPLTIVVGTVLGHRSELPLLRALIGR